MRRTRFAFPCGRVARIAAIVGLLSCLPPVASIVRAEAPNVLFIVSDDLTATSLGCYGNELCRTPNLDRLAREGVRFERAYCQLPLCGPSRASFMTGLYPNRTKLLRNPGSFRDTNPELRAHPTIGGFFRRNGYFSARVSKIFHMGIPGDVAAGTAGSDDPDSWDRAFNVLAPETRSRGKLELLSPKRLQYGSNFSRILVPDGFDLTQADHMAATQAIAILESRAGRDEPFFLAVGFVRPHVPLVAPKRLFDRYPAEKISLPDVPEGSLDAVPEAGLVMDNDRRFGMNELQQRQAIAAYYASVTYMDEQVGRLLDALDELDLRKNTIVVFISDHGYNLGEHHCWMKVSLWEDSVRVPLIVSAPGMRASAGKASSAFVELIDLYPTFAQLTGLQHKQPEILQGRSLVPLLENPTRDDWPRQWTYTVNQNGGESIRTSRWRYNHWPGDDGGEELYDHENDPHEHRNLAGHTEHADRLKELRGILEQTRAVSRR